MREGCFNQECKAKCLEAVFCDKEYQPGTMIAELHYRHTQKLMVSDIDEQIPRLVKRKAQQAHWYSSASLRL